MVVSAAKLEANRRNAQKSTGPRTQAGKKHSKMAALKHGTHAETLVLPEEDPRELEDRRAAWTASLGPHSELEQRAVDDAVIYSWRQDRARRAEAGQADVRMADGGESERAADLLAFDETPEGERLRRFELASSRGYTRAIDTFLKLRKEDRGRRHEDMGCDGADRQWLGISGPLSGGPWSDGDDRSAAIAETDAPNEPTADSDVDLSWAAGEGTDRWEIAPNEPTDRWEIAPNGPADRFENAPNEPTGGLLNIDANPLSQSGCATDADDVTNANEPTAAHKSVTNESTDRRENVTNEPTDGPLSVVVGTLLGDGSSAIGEAMPGAESGVGRDSTELEFDMDYQSMRARYAAIERHRAERLRKMNEESSQAEQGARAT